MSKALRKSTDIRTSGLLFVLLDFAKLSLCVKIAKVSIENDIKR